MQFIDNEIELRGDTEVSDILAELSVELTKQTLKTQIQAPNNNGDLLSIILDKLNYIQKSYSDDDEAMQLVNEVRKDILIFTLTNIMNTYDIGYSIDEDDLYELENITVALYEILVLKYSTNQAKFFINYILENKEKLAKEYDHCIQNKDLSGITYKTQNADITIEEYIILVSLPLSLKSLYDMTREIDVNTYLEISGANKFHNGNKIDEWFKYGKLCGSFVEKYMDLLNNELGNMRPILYENVKMKLQQRFNIIN